MDHQHRASLRLVKTNFGGMVRVRRKAVGLTLAELSHRAGLSANYLQTVEAGERDVSLSSIEAIAEALGLTPGELLGDVKRLSLEAVAAGRLFEKLGEEGRAVVASLLVLLGGAASGAPARSAPGKLTAPHPKPSRGTPRRRT